MSIKNTDKGKHLNMFTGKPKTEKKASDKAFDMMTTASDKTDVDFSKLSSTAHTVLAGAGMIPAIGNVADVARIQEGSNEFSFLTTGNAYANIYTADVIMHGDLIHYGDTDTYLKYDTDRVRIYAGGEVLLDLTEASQDVVKLGDGGDVDINLNDDMFIEGSSGRVGIGETSVDANLHVTGSPCVFKMQRTSVRELRMGIPDDSSDFVFADSDDLKSNQRMELTGGGDVHVVNNLGVGTAAPLGVLNVIVPTFSSRDTDAQQVIIANSGDAGKGIRFGYDNSGHKAYVNVLDPGVAWGSLCLQDGGGYVGIGTDSPAEKLTIKAAGDTSQELIKIRNNSNTEILSLGIDGSVDGYLNFNS